MGAPTEYYVDPGLGSDTGDGSSGTPWGRASGSVIQYAIDTVAADNTNGIRINVKSDQVAGIRPTTFDTLAATLNLTSYAGTPSTAAPLIIQGYSATAGDGGIGGIDGASSYGVFNGSEDYIQLVDLDVKDTNATGGIFLDNNSSVINCFLTGQSGSYGIYVDYGVVANCCVTNTNGYGIRGGPDSVIYGNYIANGTATMLAAINLASSNGRAINNIISIGSTTLGIDSSAFQTIISGNSIYSAGGSGSGIRTQNGYLVNIINNLIEGFSSSGVGIDFNSTTNVCCLYANNGFYNCTTNEGSKTAGEFWLFEDDNESLAASPFAKTGSDTFANRFAYFAPVDTGNVYGGAYPSGSNFDKGAVQHTASGGGIYRRLAKVIGG